MKITKENFILELKKKNEEALEYVIDNYGWIVKTIVRKHLFKLNSYEDDCINDIFLGIWNNISSFNKSKNTFENWIAAISKYKAIDYKRKYFKDLKNKNIESEIIISNYEKEFLSNITKNELDENVESLLNCLNKKDKNIFLSLYVEENNLDYISKITGMKKENIYNRISRGKKKLRSLFGGIR